MKLSKMYERIEMGIPFILFIVILVAILVQVFSRSFFGHSFSSTVEFCRFAVIFLTFMGAGYVRSKDSHIKIEALSRKIENSMPPLGKLLFWLFKQSIIVTFLITLILWSFEYAMRTKNIPSPALNIKMMWVYLFVCFGCTGYLVREVVDSIPVLKSYLRGMK